MSKYTAKQVACEADLQEDHIADMLRACAALLCEREAAKAGVTDEMRAKACAAYTVAMNGYGSKLQNHSAHEVAMRAALEAVAPMLASAALPIPMILHCPSCGLQHIDKPETHHLDLALDQKGMDSSYSASWDNPPHRSHLCHGCGTIWRPADVPTTGVAKIQTQGKHDITMPAQKLASARVPNAEITALKNLAYDMRQQAGNNNRLTHIGWAQRVERVVAMCSAAPKPETEE